MGFLDRLENLFKRCTFPKWTPLLWAQTSVYRAKTGGLCFYAVHMAGTQNPGSQNAALGCNILRDRSGRDGSRYNPRTELCRVAEPHIREARDLTRAMERAWHGTQVNVNLPMRNRAVKAHQKASRPGVEAFEQGQPLKDSPFGETCLCGGYPCHPRLSWGLVKNETDFQRVLEEFAARELMFRFGVQLASNNASCLLSASEAPWLPLLLLDVSEVTACHSMFQFKQRKYKNQWECDSRPPRDFTAPRSWK